MKKLSIILILIASFIVINAQVRSCNLLLTLTSPIEYDFVQTNKTMNVNVAVKNLGPDVITTNDTLIYTIRYDGDSVISAGKPIQKGYYGYTIAINQEVTQVLFGGGITQNYNTGGVHIYCVDVKLQNRSTTAGCSDPSTANNTSCHHVYVTTFNVGMNNNISSGRPGDISVSPNPANNSATLKYSVTENTDLKLSIMDLQGRTVMTVLNESQTPGDYEKSVDLSGLNSGIYFVQYTSNGKMLTSKLVKQ